ncbi:MAG: NADPH-dependent FMN reductase [Flammeovirgaceae bacterium]
MKKILAIVGSNSSKSINRKLAAYAIELAGDAQVALIDMQDFDIPIYSPDRQAQEGFPPEIETLFAKIQEQDALIIVSPEYNGSIPAAFKNVIDWLSRINMKFLGNKPVLLLSTSPGKNGGATNLKNMKPLLGWWGGRVVDSYSLGNFHQVYDAEQKQLTGEAALKLQELVQRLVNEINVVNEAAIV